MLGKNPWLIVLALGAANVLYGIFGLNYEWYLALGGLAYLMILGGGMLIFLFNRNATYCVAAVGALNLIAVSLGFPLKQYLILFGLIAAVVGFLMWWIPDEVEIQTEPQPPTC